MRRDNMVRMIAGLFVFFSSVLGFLHHRYWLFFTMFVGLNLFQYSLSGWCLLEKVLARLGVRQ